MESWEHECGRRQGGKEGRKQASWESTMWHQRSWIVKPVCLSTCTQVLSTGLHPMWVNKNEMRSELFHLPQGATKTQLSYKHEPCYSGQDMHFLCLHSPICEMGMITHVKSLTRAWSTIIAQNVFAMTLSEAGLGTSRNSVPCTFASRNLFQPYCRCPKHVPTPRPSLPLSSSKTCFRGEMICHSVLLNMNLSQGGACFLVLFIFSFNFLFFSFYFYFIL